MKLTPVFLYINEWMNELIEYFLIGLSTIKNFLHLFKHFQHFQDVESYIPVYQDTTAADTEFKSLLKKQGFFVRHCECPEFSYKFSNTNQLSSAVQSVNPFLTRIPVGLQQAGVERDEFIFMSFDPLIRFDKWKLVSYL